MIRLFGLQFFLIRLRKHTIVSCYIFPTVGIIIDNFENGKKSLDLYWLFWIIRIRPERRRK